MMHETWNNLNDSDFTILEKKTSKVLWKKRKSRTLKQDSENILQ